MAQFLIMRHGEAANSAPSDAERPLTSAGEKEAVAAAKWLMAQKFSVGLIIASPYLRAQQTAAIVAKTIAAKTLAGEFAIQTDERITPDASPSDFIELLDAHAVSGAIPLVVSHNPLLTRVTQLLLQGHSDGFGGGQFQYRTASVGFIEAEFCAPGLSTMLGWYE